MNSAQIERQARLQRLGVLPPLPVAPFRPRDWLNISTSLPVMPPPPTVGIQQIQRIVADYYDMTVAVLISRRRSLNVVIPRWIAMYLACRYCTTKSISTIGRAFDRPDHSTICNGRDQIAERRGREPGLDAEVAELEAIIKRQAALS